MPLHCNPHTNCELNHPMHRRFLRSARVSQQKRRRNEQQQMHDRGKSASAITKQYENERDFVCWSRRGWQTSSMICATKHWESSTLPRHVIYEHELIDSIGRARVMTRSRKANIQRTRMLCNNLDSLLNSTRSNCVRSAVGGCNWKVLWQSH